jgi:transposase
MTRKVKINISSTQKLEYAKLMVDEGYTNKQIQGISGACSSAISRWKPN